MNTKEPIESQEAVVHSDQEEKVKILTPTQPSSNNGWIIPTLIVIIVLLVGTVFYLFGRTTTPISDVKPTNTPTTTIADVTQAPTVTMKPEETATPTKKPVSTLPMYTNEKYGFTIAYEKPYRAMDDADNLYGYPHGVVLIYAGGQAYDIVVEVWDTKAAYEKEYATRMADVTVHEVKGKFITLLDNTKEAGNKKVIDSFTLLP